MTLLYTHNWHYIVNQLYSYIKKKKKKRSQREDRSSWPQFGFHYLPLEDSIQAGQYRSVSRKALCPLRGVTRKKRSEALGKCKTSDPQKLQLRAWEYVQNMWRCDRRDIFPWENTELWERSQVSGGGKYFSNFKIGKRMNSWDEGPISSTLITDNNEEVIINRLMGSHHKIRLN